MPIGGSFTFQDNFFSAPFTKAVQASDIQCPTWGIASEITAVNDQYYGYRVVGPPFDPLYEPPSQIIDLDPEWQACTYIYTDGDHLLSWAIFDPPYALTPASQLGPVSADPKTTSSLPSGYAATPAQSPTSVVSTTGAVALHSVPDVLPGFAASSISMAQSSIISPFPYLAPGSQPTQTASDDPAIGDPGSPSLTIFNTLASVILDPGIGGLIYSAFGGTPITLVIPSSVPLQSLAFPIQSSPFPLTHIFTIAGETFTANPSAFSIDSTTLIAGLAGVSLSGTPISLATGGFLLLGTSTINLNAPVATVPAVLTIGTNAYPYTLDSSSQALIIGTQTLTSRGSITVSGGDVLSLAPGGTAVIVVAPDASTFTEILSVGQGVSTTGGGVGYTTSSGIVTYATATGEDGIVFASKGAGRRGAMLGNLALTFVLVYWVAEAGS